MSKEPIWIIEEVVHALHNRQLAEHGGGEGIRDQGLLESALTAPKNKFHYSQSEVHELAACYGFSIAKNHPFIDGNKRTAWVCTRLFLKLNSQDLKASPEEKVKVMLALAAGDIDQDQFATWIKEHLS